LGPNFFGGEEIFAKKRKWDKKDFGPKTIREGLKNTKSGPPLSNGPPYTDFLPIF